MTPRRRVSPKPPGEGAILVVDDERSVRQATGRLLARLGYEVLVASSPEEALQIFASHPGRIGLLLTDVVMPGMTGRQLAEEIRQMEPRLPILYMSGDPSSVIGRDDVLPPGMFLLSKPFFPEKLSAAVREARTWRMP